MDQAPHLPLNPVGLSIHTVTAFLYAGIPGRYYWLTAIAGCPLPFLGFLLGTGNPAPPALYRAQAHRFRSRPGHTIKTLATIITYAMCINVFFYLL